MSDYTELVKALRCCISKNPPETCVGCTYSKCNNECAVRRMILDAAAAIEALQTEVDTLKRTDSKRCQECLYLGQPVGEQLLPKRGELVRCKECIHFTQGGWCDREFDWFPVDKNDFCSMAEKMEVQE